MTCKDKFAIDYPDCDIEYSCPSDCNYLSRPDYCCDGADNSICETCWERELPEEPKGSEPVSDLKETCKPNYEDMYNDMVLKVESQKDDIKQLKTENRILEHKLAWAKGAIAMVEVIYGRQWKPSNLEMIR